MTRPRTVTDQAILDAARFCAVERGPAVSLDVIARRVGLTSPALLKRFGSRQELMIAALRPTDPPAWVRDLESGPDDQPLEQQLRTLIDRVLDFLSSEMPCMTALSESGFPVDEIFDRSQAPAPFRSIWALSGWLNRAQQRGLVDAHAVDGVDFEGVATGLLGALHGRVFLSDFMGTSFWRRSRDEYVADLAHIYARALAPTDKRPKAKRRKTATRLSQLPPKRKKS
jgi:AcrR family transcriptional regulator